MMKFLTRYKNIFLYLALLGVFLAYYFLFFYQKGFLFFGDFNPGVFKSQFAYVWSSKNLGYDYSAYLAPLPYWFLSHAFVSIFGLYFGTQLSFVFPIIYFFSTVYWLALTIFKIKPWQAFLLGLLAIFNPITLGYMYFGGVDITLTGFASIAWAITFLYLYLQNDTKKRTLFFGLAVFFSAMSIHLVYFSILIILSAIYLLFEFIVNKEKLQTLKRAFWYYLTLILFSFYWLLPFFYTLVSHNVENITLLNNGGVSVLNALKKFSTINQVLSFYYYDALQKDFGFNRLLEVVILLTFGFFFYLLAKNSRSQQGKILSDKRFLVILILFLTSIFFSTGPNEPFGQFFTLMFQTIPLFQGLRTYIRFELIIFISFCLFFASLFEINRKKRLITGSLAVLILVLTAFFASHFRYLNSNGIVPLQLPESYQKFFQEPASIDALTLDSPYNMYGQQHTWGTTAIDGFLTERNLWYSYTGYLSSSDIRKQLMRTLNNDGIPQAGSRENFISMIAFSNTRQIIYHKDKKGTSRTIAENSSKILNDWQSLGLISENYSDQNLIRYQVNDQYFYPHFYVPEKVITTKVGVEKFASIVAENLQTRLAVFSQKRSSDNDPTSFMANNSFIPKLEFKKINPAKYRLIIHDANGSFPLVFSENFNRGWKIYQVKHQPVSPDDLNNLMSANNYRQLSADIGDQANREDLVSYINQGLISNLKISAGQDNSQRLSSIDGTGENCKAPADPKIGFVSKSFQGTIQNDNIESGPISETWLKKSLFDSSHFEANGYANSWILDTDTLCKDADLCKKNSDGTYDIELVIEFWSQRLLYLGVLISGLTFLMYFLFVFYKSRRYKK